LLQGPYSCAAHDRRFVFQQSFDIWQKRFITGIARSDQHIADKRSRPMRFTGEPENKVRKPGRRASRSARRGAFRSVAGFRASFRWLPGRTCSRADGEAVVAAIDAVADRLAEFMRDRPLVLDGEVGNAAARVDAIGRGKGLGRTGVEAGAAGAAMVAVRRVGFGIPPS
jgi:hypothetical protein